MDHGPFFSLIGVLGCFTTGTPKNNPHKSKPIKQLQNPRNPSLAPPQKFFKEKDRYQLEQRGKGFNNGARPYEDREEVVSPGDRALLLAHDPRFPHEQEGS